MFGNDKLNINILEMFFVQLHLFIQHPQPSRPSYAYKLSVSCVCIPSSSSQNKRLADFVSCVTRAAGHNAQYETKSNCVGAVQSLRIATEICPKSILGIYTQMDASGLNWRNYPDGALILFAYCSSGTRDTLGGYSYSSRCRRDASFAPFPL